LKSILTNEQLKQYKQAEDKRRESFAAKTKLKKMNVKELEQ
jgi:hypothetical protein